MGTLSFSSGVLAGTGAVSVSGLTTWTGGQFGNGVAGGTTTAGGGLLIGGSPTKALNGYRLVNPGTATWSGAGNITLFNAAVLDNRGTFNATNDALINSGGGSQTFANSGIFNKSSAVNGVTVIGIDFNNSGTVNVNSGTLDLSSASFTQSSGSINLLGGNVSGGLSLVGGLLTGSGTITGNITVGGTISPGSGVGSIGRLSIVGNVTLTGGAHFVADLNGSNSTDRLAIVGNLDLSGTNDILDINSAGADFSNGNSFIIATYTGSLTGVFDHIPAGLTVTYQTQSHQIVVTPEPTSMAMVAVGLMLLTCRRRRRILKT